MNAAKKFDPPSIMEAAEMASYIRNSDDDTAWMMAQALAFYGYEGRAEFEGWLVSVNLDPKEKMEKFARAEQRIAAGHGDRLGWLRRHALENGWRPVADEQMTPAQREAVEKDRRQAKERAAQRAMEAEREAAAQAEKAAQAAERARLILSASKTATDDTPYLAKKGVRATSTLSEIGTDQLQGFGYSYPPKGSKGERLQGRLLVAPFWRPGEAGTLELSTLELIDQGGNKAALKGGRKSGAFWRSGDLPGKDTPDDSRVVVVAEGVATALSLAMATGHVAVACGSLGNFDQVLGYLREAMPWLRLVLAADIEKGSGKVGEKVKATARKHGAVLAFPVFGKDREATQTDFNDLHQGRGIDAVREQVNAMIYSHDFGNTGNSGTSGSESNQAGQSGNLTVAMQEILDRFAIVLLEGKACVVYREQNQLGRMETKFSNPKDMRYMWSDAKAFDNPESKLSAFDYWMMHRRKYNRVIFVPMAGEVQDNEALPDTSDYNLYQGLAFKPVPGECKRIIGHIREVWCNSDDKAFDYVMGWLARMFQYPDERGHTVLLLRSGEGTGKNIIVDMLVRAFGEHAMVANKPDDLVGKFNDQLATSVLVFANEAVWGGDKSLEGALKTLITDEDLVVEKKYIPKYRVKNCCHVIMTSNNDWAAPVGLDDRRYFMLEVSEKYKGNDAYFTALKREIDQGGQAAFIHALLNWDISGFNPRERPELRTGQNGLLEMKLKGADSVTAWWFDVLWTGAAWVVTESNMGMRTRRNIMVNWDLGPIQVGADDLRNAYQQWCTANRRHVESEVAFGRKLTDLCSIERRRVRVEGERRYVYLIGHLGTARQEVGTKVRQAVDWPELD